MLGPEAVAPGMEDMVSQQQGGNPPSAGSPGPSGGAPQVRSCVVRVNIMMSDNLSIASLISTNNNIHQGDAKKKTGLVQSFRRAMSISSKTRTKTPSASTPSPLSASIDARDRVNTVSGVTKGGSGV